MANNLHDLAICEHNHGCLVKHGGVCLVAFITIHEDIESNPVSFEELSSRLIKLIPALFRSKTSLVDHSNRVREEVMPVNAGCGSDTGEAGSALFWSSTINKSVCSIQPEIHCLAGEECRRNFALRGVQVKTELACFREPFLSLRQSGDPSGVTHIPLTESKSLFAEGIIEFHHRLFITSFCALHHPRVLTKLNLTGSEQLGEQCVPGRSDSQARALRCETWINARGADCDTKQGVIIQPHSIGNATGGSTHLRVDVLFYTNQTGTKPGRSLFTEDSAFLSTKTYALFFAGGITSDLVEQCHRFNISKLIVSEDILYAVLESSPADVILYFLHILIHTHSDTGLGRISILSATPCTGTVELRVGPHHSISIKSTHRRDEFTLLGNHGDFLVCELILGSLIYGELVITASRRLSVETINIKIRHLKPFSWGSFEAILYRKTSIPSKGPRI